MALLTPSADLFLAFGGHREAAGFSVSKDKKEALRSSLEATYHQLMAHRLDQGQPGTKVQSVDWVLASDDLCFEFYEEVMSYGPYGVGFPKPLFAVEALRSEARDLGASGEHISFSLAPRGSKASVKAVGFGLRPLLDQIQTSRVYLIGELTLNIWRDQKNIQFLIRDIAPISS